MTEHPKVSICIPTYNQVQFIRAAIESALGQAFDSFEVIVSDNYCTDGTSAYLESLHDPRLRVVKPSRHLTVTEHFDFCASHARGDYIVLFSSDNLFYPQFSARLSEVLDNSPEIAFAYCAADFIDGEGAKFATERHVGGSCHRTRKQALTRFMRGARCVFDAMMIRRTCFEECGGLGVARNGVLMLEVPDWDLDIRLAATGDVYYLDEILVAFREWSAPNRTAKGPQGRLPGYVADIALMFEHTVEEVVARYPDLKTAAMRARRAIGRNCAVGVGQLLGLDTYPEAVRNVLRIHDSPLVRLIFLMQRAGLGPVLAAAKGFKFYLRRQVKELLYQTQ